MLLSCFLSDLLRRQEELRRMEELHSQEMQKRKEMQIRYWSKELLVVGGERFLVGQCLLGLEIRPDLSL